MNHRIVTAELFHAEHKTSDFIRDTGYSPRTVHCIVANLRKGKGIERKAYSSRSDKICTTSFFDSLKWFIAANTS